ncbi:MAG: hypothetical protein PWQ18_670 [Clostridia bacterium]|nr:hypothetical protein [Clostridia bacterium]
MASFDELQQALADLRQAALRAVDISAELRLKDPGARQEVARQWEETLGAFWHYIKQKGKETNQNLLAGISFPPRR